MREILVYPSDYVMPRVPLAIPVSVLGPGWYQNPAYSLEAGRDGRYLR